jgi:hypothetical protein
MTEIKSGADYPECPVEVCWEPDTGLQVERVCAANHWPPGFLGVLISRSPEDCLCGCPPAHCAASLCAAYGDFVAGQCAQFGFPSGYPLLILDERTTALCVCLCGEPSARPGEQAS